MSFTDLKSVSDTVRREELWSVLKKYGVEEYLLRDVNSLRDEYRA